MLSLSRRKGQSIFINTSDGPIKIKIAKVSGTTVGVAIEAPAQCKIYRDDLLPSLPTKVLEQLSTVPYTPDTNVPTTEFNPLTHEQSR